MSTLVVSNINDGTTTVPATYVTNGSAKAWVNFNGQGTIAERNSFNVSSLADNGTGDYTVSFSAAFNAADYTMAGSGVNDGSGWCSINILSTSLPSTSAMRIRALGYAALFDPIWVTANFFGDLA